MSFNMNVASVITSVVEDMFPRFSQSEQGLHIKFNAQVEEPSDASFSKTEKVVFFTVHFLFRRASNCTNVWYSICDNCYDLPEMWENTSNHNSCWRTDGVSSVLNKLYFEMCQEVNEDVPPKWLETKGYRMKMKNVKIEGLRSVVEPCCRRKWEFDQISEL